MILHAIIAGLCALVCIAMTSAQRYSDRYSDRLAWRRMLCRDGQHICDRACAHLLLSPNRIYTPAEYGALCDAATRLHNASHGAVSQMLRTYLQRAVCEPTYYRPPQPRKRPR